MKQTRRYKQQPDRATLTIPVGSTERASFFDISHNPTDPSAVELLTISDVARLFKLSQSTVRRLQQRRLIPFIKVGGGIRFVPDDIASYLARQRMDRVGPPDLWQHD